MERTANMDLTCPKESCSNKLKSFEERFDHQEKHLSSLEVTTQEATTKQTKNDENAVPLVDGPSMWTLISARVLSDIQRLPNHHCREVGYGQSVWEASSTGWTSRSVQLLFRILYSILYEYSVDRSIILIPISRSLSWLFEAFSRLADWHSARKGSSTGSRYAG